MPLSYLDLEKASLRRIWAVNKTSKNERRQLIFTVAKNSGQGQDVIFLPSTWIPIDLTGQITKKNLLDSSDFRKAVSAGIITILTEEEAATINAEEGASLERERIAAQLMNVNAITQRETIEEEEDSSRDELESSAKIVQFVEDMKLADEITSLNNLRSMGTLDIKELRFVRKAAKEMNYARIRKYCSLEMKKLKGEIDQK